MNILQKQQIIELRGKGTTYSNIAAELGISENTVKSYCRRNGIGHEKDKVEVCSECGLSLIHLPSKRQKRFCSEKCRLTWWAKHPEALNRRAVYDFVCCKCGSNFTAYGNAKRKYCSRKCSDEARRAAK